MSSEVSDRARDAAIAMWDGMADDDNKWANLSTVEQDAMVAAFAKFEREIAPPADAAMVDVERAIRSFADKHGPSGPAWNISALLDALRAALAQSDRRHD